jgi:hypothetical protein
LRAFAAEARVISRAACAALTAPRGSDSLALLGPRAFVVSVLLVLTSPSGAARAETPPLEAAAAETDAFLSTYYPPPLEGPELRLPVSPTRVWADLAYARTGDLSSLPYITGKGQNVRLAVGGAWRWRRFAFTGEIPILQATTIDVGTIMNQPPVPDDRHKTGLSLGDLRVGADWTDHLGEAIVAGVGFRTRIPTHTTGFEFHLVDGSTAFYALPYYFHLEPTAIFGAVVGRFAFVVNQGAVILIGPDADFADLHIHVPTIAFWDAAYAVSWAPLESFAASIQLSTDVQLNHVDGLDFTKFNDLKSVWLAPGVQWHVAGYRVDAVARFGLSNGANLFGIMEFAGTSSYTLRVTRPF